MYAEVLYSFKAVGAEELSLERGALVEVLRIESGPWWWGQIKHDAILSGPQHEPLQGWFPRDFVKVIFNRILPIVCVRACVCEQFIYAFLIVYWLHKVIEPFPRPNKNASIQQASIQLTTDLNNCDIEYVQKPISPILSKPQEAHDAMQSSQITNEAMKENVTRELIETEENYVKLLSSLCIG